MPGKLLYFATSLAVASLFLHTPARAADYPTTRVRIVVPYSAGGTPDTVARLLAKRLTADLHQSFYVENKAGANGLLASDIVASSRPDGYTLLLASDGPIVIMPLLRRSSDPLKKLVPVNLTAESAFVLLARTNLGVHDLKGVIALAKKQHLTFGSAGFGSQHHLAGELLNRRAGINLTHVPYKGFADAVTDLMGKRIDLAFGGIPPSLPYIEAKKVMPIAVTSVKRSRKLPSVPTFTEEGIPNYRVAFWVGIMAPKGTPTAVIRKLNGAITKIVKTPDIQKRFEQLGIDTVNAGPKGFAQRLASDKGLWADLIKQTGLKMQ